jgi:hypothetical protein
MWSKVINCQMVNNKVSILKISVLFFLTILVNLKVSAQETTKNEVDPSVRNYREVLFIRTDRDLYITGEQVWFKVYEFNGIPRTLSDLSKVVYVEMLDENNFPLKQIKVKTEKSTGYSVFTLPDKISSGNYIIRAYTNWMKNFSSDLFFYKTISVINPFESIDHLKIPADISKSDSLNKLQGIISQTSLTDEDGNKLNGAPVLNENTERIRYTISLSKKDYTPREKLIMEITAVDMSGKPVATECTVSVAKSAVVNSTGLTSFYCFNRNDEVPGRSDGADYLAELEGHLISGHIRLKATDEPLKHTDLSLSFVGKKARCQFGKTNDSGEFNFVIKESGPNEIVIQPLSPEIQGYYIELNQPFSSTFSRIKPAIFYLDSSKIDAINKVIIGMQVDNIYQPFRQNNYSESTSPIHDFYGKPENSIKMTDFIELTSLREVVKEIIPNVYTQRQNGKYDFKLINKFRGQPFENKPLILVDGVPVNDFEKVLSINSREIERADIINTRYFFSEYVFDGIVSFITKKGNLSVMEFDNPVFRQVYEGCQDRENFYSPDFSTSALKNNRIPDYRNTLLWKPDLQTNKDGKAEVEFFTSDESSDFTIVVEGISADGRTGYSTASFRVR